MSRRVHFSVTALSEAAGGQALPSLPVTLSYVAARGGDVREWEKRWRSLHDEVGSGSCGNDAPHVPYLGLSTFHSDDAEWFFSRAKLVEELRARIADNYFFAVFAASGAGKSSLLRAGLLPLLINHAPPDSPTWLIALLTPGEHPLQELAARLAELDGAPVMPPDVWPEGALTVQRTIRQTLVNQSGETRVLIVVDQFEEMFTLCRDQ